jgi:DNA-binding transcriptional LysR family regulator
MTLNFNHLVIFQKVAEKGHFTRAAEELLISQPAVSKQVHELEKTLQQPLFTRVGQKVYLTEAGEVLADYANRIVALAVEAEAVLQELQGLERGRLAVGASTTIGTYLLPELLGRYKVHYPEIEIFIDVANTETIQNDVRVHKLEIGLIEGDVLHPDLEYRPWQPDELVLIAAPRSEYGRRGHIALKELFSPHFPLISREPGSGTRAVLESAFARHGVPSPHASMELGSPEAIKRTVAAGIGYAFVSKSIIQHEVAAGLLRQIPIEDFEVHRTLFVVYASEKRISRAARAFVDLIGIKF